jgi:hypothetical protein
MQKWKPVREERYTEMLEMLWPACWLGKGFLVGEASSHRACRVTQEVSATYSPFLTIGGQFFEGREAITIAEFKALDARAATHV